MKLIVEHIEDIELLTEEKDGKEYTYIQGVFLQGDIKNRNGRVYPMPVLQREVTNYTENFVNKSRALGELGHPDGPTINLDRVSHKIVELYQDGSNYIGKAKLLETPMGSIAKNLLREGVQLGVSSRGVGSLESKDGSNYVRDDFMLTTAADIVADPSAPDAFVNGIMEGKEWVWNNGILKEYRVSEYKQYISEATDLSNISDGHYEFLISSNCLEHSANPLKAILEWRTVLKEKGILILVVPKKDLNFDHTRRDTEFNALLIPQTSLAVKSPFSFPKR